jgi:DNA-binding transcriptional LysR family regulator
MDLKLLKAFVGVTEHGTVSKAAALMRVTQPALSRQIRSLERLTGLKLFERAGRGLVLTPHGERFLRECRALLSHADAFDERARELRRGELQVLRVVAASLAIEALFPAFLSRYAEQVHDVRLVLLDALAADHLEMLERGEADLSINVIDMLPLDDRHFACRALPHFHMLAACAPSFAVEAGDLIDIAVLAQYPLLVLDPSYATRNVFDAACHLAGIKPSIMLEARSVNALLALAEAGHGIAIIPSVLKIDPARIRTRLVTHRRELLELTAAVIWDRRRMHSRHADQFADLLTAHVREFYPPPAVSAGPGAKPSARKGAHRATRPGPAALRRDRSSATPPAGRSPTKAAPRSR